MTEAGRRKRKYKGNKFVNPLGDEIENVFETTTMNEKLTTNRQNPNGSEIDSLADVGESENTLAGKTTIYTTEEELSAVKMENFRTVLEQYQKEQEIKTKDYLLKQLEMSTKAV